MGEEGGFKKTSYDLPPLGHLLRSPQLTVLTALDSFLPEHIPSSFLPWHFALAVGSARNAYPQLHSAGFLPFKSQSKCQPRGTFPDRL